MTPQIPDVVLQRWEISPVSYLGGRLNQHWLVEHRHSRLVVRGYSDGAFPHIGYELEVLARLDEAGWPVPTAVEEPIQVDGRTWGLFKFLPGTCHTSNRPEERRARGRLLAELHQTTASLTRRGQRRGFGLSDEVIGDPGLIDSIRKYERRRPSEGHIMRWHVDQAAQVFDRLDLDEAVTTVLHGDFTPWNLLYEGENLTGVLDFEATHLNYRVADFANSWRGYQDEVIEGYEEVCKLSDLDWELLMPVYWAWMFIGVKKSIETSLEENAALPDFEWQIRHLLRREGLTGRFADPYPK
ncbi:MAG: phosphotransferase [Dehalococcoidia bacterium]|nr:phosphotransferase [Dehalococcoidia bacterium]